MWELSLRGITTTTGIAGHISRRFILEKSRVEVRAWTCRQMYALIPIQIPCRSSMVPILRQRYAHTWWCPLRHILRPGDGEGRSTRGVAVDTRLSTIPSCRTSGHSGVVIFARTNGVGLQGCGAVRLSWYRVASAVLY